MKYMLEKLMDKRAVGVVRFAVFMAMVLVGAFALAESREEVELVVEKLQKRYESTRDFAATFRQETDIRSLNRRTHGRGKLYFKRPGKMLWRYEEPKGQWVLTDGSHFYYHQPEQRQILKSPLKNAWNSDIPLSFLLGLGNLRRDFSALLKESESKEYRLQLLPKAERKGVGELSLGVDPETFDILWAQIVDLAGNTTTMRFSDLQRDVGLRESLFQVKIPEGVEVVELGL